MGPFLENVSKIVWVGRKQVETRLKARSVGWVFPFARTTNALARTKLSTKGASQSFSDTP
jgi:hypothetical protein